MEANNPTFIGIGAQKCATSWLYRVLRDHSDVFVSDPKELNFFSHKFDHGYQWYRKFFTTDVQHLAYGEISPSYFYDESAPKRAYDFCPSLKILVSMRDPVARAFSNHLHEIRGKHIGIDTSFEAGIENNPMYLEQSMYCLHLERWLDVFPRDQFVFFFQEEISKNPEFEHKRLCEFLDIDAGQQLKNSDLIANKSDMVKNHHVDKVKDTIVATLRRIRLDIVVDTLRRNKLAAQAMSMNMVNLRSIVAQPDDAMTLRLRNLFSAHDEKLKTLLERDSLPWELK